MGSCENQSGSREWAWYEEPRGIWNVPNSGKGGVNGTRTTEKHDKRVLPCRAKKGRCWPENTCSLYTNQEEHQVTGWQHV